MSINDHLYIWLAQEKQKARAEQIQAQQLKRAAAMEKSNRLHHDATKMVELANLKVKLIDDFARKELNGIYKD